MTKFVKNRRFSVLIVIILVIIAAGGYWYLAGQKKPAYDFAVVQRKNLVQEVSVTGRIKPVKSVDLAFEKSGRISVVNVKVGDRLAAGELLIQLDGSELNAQLDKTRADLAAQEAEFAKSKIILNNYYQGAADVLNDAYTKTNDAVRKQTDELFSDDERSPKLTFIVSNSQIQNDVEFQRLQAGAKLNEWREELNNLNPAAEAAEDVMLKGLANAEMRLVFVRGFLDRALDVVLDSVNLSQATINTYKTNINTGRANINAGLAAVNNQSQSIKFQKAAVVSLEAGVESQKANVKNIEAQLAKTFLYAPINGVVTAQDGKIGETTAANKTLVSIISASQLEIEANVPEADIAKIKSGDQAKATLDAYGSETVFPAKIVKINPAETIVDGVATYKTTFQFLEKDERVKSGMTANIDVLIASRDNVIAVPRRAIISKNGGKIVRLLGAGDKIIEVPVKTGLDGSDGDTEIIEGIKEGDKVIIFTK